MTKSMRGFSLLEVLIVMALILIGGSIALVQMRNSMKIIDADKAINLVTAQVRYGRQVAVDERRNVLVEFLGTNEVKVTRQDGGGATTVLADVFLPTGFTFSRPGGIGDTPNGYNNGSVLPVYFNAATSGTFLADGIFIDGSNIVVNGTVFTMNASNGTARALALTGASGRAKTYWLQGATWVAQ